MITPIELRSHEFRRSLWGFSKNEVRNFLFQLAQDYEQVYSENNLLKEKYHNLQMQLESYQQMEQTMNQSIIFAQQASDMMKASAKEETRLLIEAARQKIVELFSVYQEVVKRLNMMNTEIKAQLDIQMSLFDKNQRRIEEYTTYFLSNDFKELMEDLHKITSVQLDEIHSEQDNEP